MRTVPWALHVRDRWARRARPPAGPRARAPAPGDERAARAPRPRRRGRLDERRRLDRPRASTPQHHRRVTRGSPALRRQRRHVITYNGEIYNYLELRAELEDDWTVPQHLRHRGDPRGLSRVGAWTASTTSAACSRSPSGTASACSARATGSGSSPSTSRRPGSDFVFASEVKALLPFLPDVATDPDALAEYLVFQYPISNRTLFRDVTQLLPGHALLVERGDVRIWRYWDVQYEPDFSLTPEAMRGAPPRARRRLGRTCTCAATCRSAPTSAAASTRAWSRSSRERTGAASGDLFHGKFSAYPIVRRERARRVRGGSDRRHAAPGRHRRRRLRAHDRAGDLPPRLPRRRAGLVPAVHGVRARAATTSRWCSAVRAATRSSAGTRDT